MSAAPPPIPTALVAPIIDGFVHAIRPAITFILIATVFGSMLVPLLILLFALSNPYTRRKPIFILNVLSVSLGIIAAGLVIHLMVKSILSPFAGINTTGTLAYIILEMWKPWFAEAVLLLRIAIVFPRSKLPVLLVFPITIKTARVVLDIIFSVQWAKRLSSSDPGNNFVVLNALPDWLLRTVFFLELFDNLYISSLFLWKLRSQRQSRLAAGSAIESVAPNNSKQSYTSKLQGLFWIATTNFVFPLILGIIQIVTIFVGNDAVLSTSFQMTNTYVIIMSTVFATIWSSTTSFQDAMAQSNQLSPSLPLIFMERTTDTTASASHFTTPDDPKHTKPEIWDET
ncbi:hypothetical protein B0H14DRAFT_2479696 [Mycena olivaceomarginata]|nr:hypothetical protein B0H14DRAFT_2479696 [Mycena olivaceomarginata]